METVPNLPDVTETVYQRLLDAICDGSLGPGERLIQDQVAQRLGVSRLPVHEAMNRLRKDGLLVDHGRRGVAVAALGSAFVREVYELRAALDMAAAAAAARNATPDDRRRGEDILRFGDTAIEAGDLRAMVEIDFLFHDFIYELAGNSLIRAAAHRNWHHVRRALLLLVRGVATAGPIWAEHRAILDAVASGDAATAGQLAQTHSLATGAKLAALCTTP